MKHWVIAYRRIPGTLAELRRRLRADLADLLRSAMDTADGQPDPDGSLLLQLPSHAIGLDVHKQVRVRTGVAMDHGDRTWIPLQWEAEPGRRAFPVFHGSIELEPLSAWNTQLTVVGAITPPLGPVGGLAETLGLGSVAERTVQHLADRLAEALLRPGVGDAGHRQGVAPVGSMSVRDVMTSHPLVLFEDMPIKTAALLLFHFDVSGAPVQTDDGGLVGVFSESDLVAVQASPPPGADSRARQRRDARTVGQACSRPAEVITPDATVVEAAKVMWDRDIARLIVVAGAGIVGIVSRHDVLRAVVRSDADVQAAVDRVLQDIGVDAEVRARVEWGVVTLTGEVAFRSAVDGLVRAVRAVDGVVGAESHVVWHSDLIPPMVP